MKITIECTPSDAADALLHLLDGGEAAADPAAQPGDEGKIVIHFSNGKPRAVSVSGRMLPTRGFNGVTVSPTDKYGETDVAVHYVSYDVETYEAAAEEGGDD